MALAVGGRVEEAERAYEWLRRTQRPDGSWHAYYLAEGIEDPKFDANVCAYIATGVWHHFLHTGDRGFLHRLWPAVESAIDFVLDLQTARGEILWARHPSGQPWPFALLTGSSSVYFSLRCAIAAAEAVGRERPDWELSAGRLAHVVAHRPDAFAPKHRWAMDWYYPVLCGAVSGDAGREHLAGGRSTFLLDGKGVRCVSDRPWVTAAETSECALAHHAVGATEVAEGLMTSVQRLRGPDGGYWTGIVYPEEKHFPGGEQSTYSSAAVVLAIDTLFGRSATSGLFRGDGLPAPFAGAGGDDFDGDGRHRGAARGSGAVGDPPQHA
jgi:hypothetical protein